MPMPKNLGRPKNPKLRAAENKVKDLLLKIEELKKEPSAHIDLTSLPRTAYAIRQVSETAFVIDVIKYDEVSLFGKLEKSLPAGDAIHRARFELQKIIATGGS